MAGQDKKHKKDVHDPCQVCRINIYDNEDLEKLVCKDCTRTVHRYCYAPDIKQKQKFKCDECKKRTQHKSTHRQNQCSFCGKSNGILKEVGNGQWMHILCALSSPRTKLNSYKTLNFSVPQSPPKKIKIPNTKKCIHCNFANNQGLHCWLQQCNSHIHMDCVLSYITPQSPENLSAAFLTIGLLDKHENSLLVHLRSELENFRGLSLVNNQKEQIKYLVCNSHNDGQYFIWCTCNEFHEQQMQIQCEKCQRWFHKNCAKMKQGLQICFGCRNNDIYVRQLKLPELIRQIQDIESSNQLDKPSIKFLDHFSIKLSETLHKIIFQKKNLFQIERYYLRKSLQGSASILQKTTNNTHNPEGINIVQIIYYLLRKQLKKESDISCEQLSQICHELSNKNNKFDWGQQKGQKIQKKYKKFIEQKLKEMQNDDSRTIKPKLKEFTRKNKEQKDRNLNDIALEINQIITMMKKSQVWQEIYQQYSEQSVETDSQQLIELFYDSNLQPTAILEILSNLKLIFKSRKLNRINESDYNRMIFPTDDTLNTQKSIKLKTSYKKLLQNVKINRIYNEKKQTFKKLQNIYTLSKNTKERNSIQQILVKDNILVPMNSILFKTETDLIEFAIIKKKYLKRSQEPNIEQLYQCITLINSLINMDQKVGKLNQEQLSNLLQVRGRYIFYSNLLNYHKKIKTFNINIPKISSMEEEADHHPELIISENIPGDGKEFNPTETPKSINQTINLVIQEWVYSTYDSVFFAFNQLYQIAKYEIKFDQNEARLIHTFIKTILQNVYKRIIATTAKIKGDVLTKMGKIIVYAHLESTYNDIIEIYEDYINWKQQLEHKFGNIEQVLENSKVINELLRVIESKNIQADDLEADISVQLKKLRVLKTWAYLSQKILSFQNTSIQTILTLKSIMEKISYPKNTLRERIERQEIEARNLNKRISRYLDKPKITDMEIYEELTFIRNKMTLEEAEQLKRDLEASELYVEIELQSLIDYIKQFKAIPSLISEQFYKNAQIEDLLTLQKRILESPFMYRSIDCYNNLLHKIYQKKCQESSVQNEDILKKDYFRFLYYGGPIGAEFYRQTQSLHKAYKDIEVAERQLLSGRAKPEHLLPSIGLKIKTDIKDDPIQRVKVDRWYQSSERLRQRYQTLRSTRAQFQKYLILQSEFNRLPINNRQILIQIGKIKRQIEQLTTKTKRYLGSSTIELSTLQFENPYTNDIVHRYRMTGARTEYMDRFQSIYMKNKEIMELGRNVSIENYKLFSQNCQEVAELINNNEVYRMREMTFQKMWKVYLQSSDPLMEIGYTLLSEGGALCRHPTKMSDILPIMFDVNRKFFKWTDNARRNPVQQAEQDEISSPESDQNEMNQNDSQEQQLMDEYDQDNELEDEEDESSSPPVKRPRQGNQIVELDDD